MSASTISSRVEANTQTALEVVPGLLVPIKGIVFDVGDFYEILMEDCGFTIDEANRAVGQLLDDRRLGWAGDKPTRLTVV